MGSCAKNRPREQDLSLIHIYHIIQGRKGGRQDSIEYDEVELGGKSSEFFLGYENDYVNYKKTQIVGYDLSLIHI